MIFPTSGRENEMEYEDYGPAVICQIYLNGKENPSFKCERCRCNVFLKIEPDIFRCNGCGELYMGERSTA